MPHLLQIVLLICAVCLFGCAEPSADVRTSHERLALGDDSVDVAIHEAEAEGFTYINLHENETTSIEAALETIRQHGGRVIHLEHSGERNITFSIGDSSFVVDPNRIFTEGGVRQTLASLSSDNPAAREAVLSFSSQLLEILSIDTLETVITVHNNTDNAYSILSYAEDGEYASDALFVHVARGKDPDDFFFLTEGDWFSSFRTAGFNVVVQDNQLVTDDGSLSVLCGQLGIPYVNVEAQQGHYQIQLQMLSFLEQFLREEVRDVSQVE